MLIPCVNNLTDKAPKTFLSNAEAASTTAIRVKNNEAFTDSWAIQLGETGEAKAEIVIGTVSSGSMTCGALSFDHPANTPIYAIRYDQIVFEKSAAGTSGTAAAITNGTVNIDPSGSVTWYDDSTGVTTDAYKTYFRASALAENSTESDWITSSGHSFYSLAAVRSRIKAKAINARSLDDDEIDDWINEWREEMLNVAIKVDQQFSMATTDVSIGTSGLGTITNTDFKKPKRIWVTKNGTDWYRCQKKKYSGHFPDEDFTFSNPHFYMQGDNIFHVLPEEACTARVSFYSLGTVLEDDADELPFSMRSYTKSFVDYGLAQARRKDKDDINADKIESKAKGELLKFQGEVTPQAQTGPEYLEIVDPIF